jgi:hypothetical protein
LRRFLSVTVSARSAAHVTAEDLKQCLHFFNPNLNFLFNDLINRSGIDYALCLFFDENPGNGREILGLSGGNV